MLILKFPIVVPPVLNVPPFPPPFLGHSRRQQSSLITHRNQELLGGYALSIGVASARLGGLPLIINNRIRIEKENYKKSSKILMYSLKFTYIKIKIFSTFLNYSSSYY